MRGIGNVYVHHEQVELRTTDLARCVTAQVGQFDRREETDSPFGSLTPTAPVFAPDRIVQGFLGSCGGGPGREWGRAAGGF